MHSKKIIALLAMVLTALLLFSACGEEEKKGEKKKEEPTTLSKEVTVVAQRGSAAVGVFRVMGENYKVKTFKKIGDVRDAVKSGKYDAAVLPSATAGEMYKRTKRGLVEMSPVTMDGVYVVASGFNKDTFRPSFMMGKRAVCMGKNTTADRVWQKVMTDQGASVSAVRMRYVNSYSAAKKAFAEWGALVVCTEPYASKLAKISEVTKVYDLSKAYMDGGRQQVPTDVLVASKAMIKNRADDVTIMMNEYEKAMENPPKSKAKLVFYNQTNRGIQLLRDFNKTMDLKSAYYEN